MISVLEGFKATAFCKNQLCKEMRQDSNRDKSIVRIGGWGNCDMELCAISVLTVDDVMSRSRMSYNVGSKKKRSKNRAPKNVTVTRIGWWQAGTSSNGAGSARRIKVYARQYWSGETQTAAQPVERNEVVAFMILRDIKAWIEDYWLKDIDSRSLRSPFANWKLSYCSNRRIPPIDFIWCIDALKFYDKSYVFFSALDKNRELTQTQKWWNDIIMTIFVLFLMTIVYLFNPATWLTHNNY